MKKESKHISRTEHIIAHFSTKLRTMATSDRIIAATGTAGYVQAVLVPELALLLIQDDLKVDESEARKVLKESGDVGELLHEDNYENSQRLGAV